MKKKVLIALSVVLLTAAISAALILVLKNGSENGENTELLTFGEDLVATIEANKTEAFAFLNKSETQLPDNMRGYCIDPEIDIDVSDTAVDALKKSVESVFDGVNAIKPNTVVIKTDAEGSYDYGDFNIIRYLSEIAHNDDMFVILSFDSDKYDSDKIIRIATETDADAVMTDENKNDISEIKEALNKNGKFFGLAFDEKTDEAQKNEITSGNADFYFAKINSSTETGVEQIVSEWTSCALKSKSKVYAVLRNDLVKSGVGYTNSAEINDQIRLLYNYGGFSGAVMASRAKLATDENEVATGLYSYYEYFNNSDYTALTLTGFEKKGNDAFVFSGTSDNQYPVYIWSTALDSWQKSDNSGENGNFTAEIPLRTGTNKLILRHKSAMYIYYVDNVTDVLLSTGVSVSDGKAVITANAVKGAKVWASVANTVLIELEPTQQENGDSVLYSAEYDLSRWLSDLGEDEVSFAAEYNGLKDIVMCGEDKKPSPYEDNGLGRSDMLVVTKNHAETTSTAAEDDSSDPTCTPQLKNSIAKTEKYSLSDNHLILSTTGGMKIYSDDVRIILNGYVMPENSVTLDSLTQDNGSSFTIKTDYPSFIKVVIEPQEYYTGFLQRIYNVESFDGEYIDLMFMDTSVCKMNENVDFASSETIEKCEWYLNSEDNFVTLRLYLRTKGVFSGYSLSFDEDGNINLIIKNNIGNLAGTVIMLDPGHGGYGSPGAASTDMTAYEKDITLSIANEAAKLLREHGATVIMTREKDEAVFLDERVLIARNSSPDVFVSIHCDGADNVSWLGTHTFYYKSYSMPLASAIHEQIVNAYRSYYYTDPSSSAYKNVDMGIKFFPYQVTRIEECPSVLVECGYLTNESNARFLSDENGQKIIATAIAQGIVDYIESR